MRYLVISIAMVCFASDSHAATYTTTYNPFTGKPDYVGGQGEAGPGVPAGGTTGQVLVKTNNGDYATQWATVQTGGGTTVFLGIVDGGAFTDPYSTQVQVDGGTW